jgi:hypothetical protein
MNPAWLSCALEGAPKYPLNTPRYLVILIEQPTLLHGRLNVLFYQNKRQKGNEVDARKMEYPSILLQTRQRGSFLYDRGYEDIPDADLIILLKLAQRTVESLETELVRRHVWIDAKQSTVVDECVQKMRKTLSTVKTLQRLEDKAGLLVENAVNIVVNQPMNRDAKLYSVFLSDVLRIGSRGLFVLCSASLGKQRIVTMNGEERLQLIRCITANKTIFECPILESLATLHRVPYQDGMNALLLPLSRAHLTLFKRAFSFHDWWGIKANLQKEDLGGRYTVR